MKEIFAKIIELDDNQVLITKKAEKMSEKETDYILRVETTINGKRMGANLGFQNIEHMNASFDEFDALKAENVVMNLEAAVAAASKPKSKIIMPGE